MKKLERKYRNIYMHVENKVKIQPYRVNATTWDKSKENEQRKMKQRREKV